MTSTLIHHTLTSAQTFRIAKFALLLTCLPFSVQGESKAEDTEFRQHWFNGAEISRYELKQVRYGEVHPGHAEFIFVTEPFLVNEQVKHERGKGESVDVLKLNALRTFNTGIYSYRTMITTFSPINIEAFPHALKSTVTVQDWCGQVFHQLNRTAAGWDFQLRSYFQAEGDTETQLEDAWLEDELWTRIRIDPESLPQGRVIMLPGSLYLRFHRLEAEPREATVTRTEQGEHYIYKIHYTNLGRQLIIRFDKQFPHIIRGWEEHEDGSELVTSAILTDRITHSNYWNKNKTSDRELRETLGLSPTAD